MSDETTMSDEKRTCIECGVEKDVKDGFRRANKTCNECIDAAKEVEQQTKETVVEKIDAAIKDVAEMTGTRLLRCSNGRVYVWTEALAKRGDCIEI